MVPDTAQLWGVWMVCVQRQGKARHHAVVWIPAALVHVGVAAAGEVEIGVDHAHAHADKGLDRNFQRHGNVPQDVHHGAGALAAAAGRDLDAVQADLG